MLLPACSIDAYLTRFIHASILTIKDLDSSIAHLPSESQRKRKSRKSHCPAVMDALVQYGRPFRRDAPPHLETTPPEGRARRIDQAWHLPQARALKDRLDATAARLPNVLHTIARASKRTRGHSMGERVSPSPWSLRWHTDTSTPVLVFSDKGIGHWSQEFNDTAKIKIQFRAYTCFYARTATHKPTRTTFVIPVDPGSQCT